MNRQHLTVPGSIHIFGPIRIIFVIAATTLAILYSTRTVLAETCDENTAYNKMMALGRVQSRLMGAGGQSSQQKAMRLTVESAPISELLAQKKFDEACGKYDAIAQKYKIDLTKESQGLVTMQELKADGGKRGGTCAQADAHIKMMTLLNQLQDRVALGDEDQSAIKRFTDETAKLSELMYTNPSELCRRLDELKGKYKLN